MQSTSHHQPAHLHSMREKYVEQISLYGKARCRFEIRLMAGEVRKMDVRLQGKREKNSDDKDGDGDGDGDGEITNTDFNKPPPPLDDDDDALLLARASASSSSSDKNLLRMGSIMREHRQSLITDEQLPTKAKKIPLAAQPESRRLSVPLELLTKEWPQLTIQHNNNLVFSRPESVYIPPTTTTTTTTSNDCCMAIPRGKNNSLENDQAASSSSFPLPLHHHENSSSSSSTSFSFSSSSNNNNNCSLYSQTGDSRLDSFGFFSSHLISLPLPTPPPPPPPPSLPDFEYGDLIGQVRDRGGSVKARARARAARARRVKKGKERQSDEKEEEEEEGIIIQPIPNPFSPPRLHRVVRLTNKEHERLQKRISRQWLVCLSILGLFCAAPWLLLLFGSGLMDEPVVDYWLTEGDLLGTGAGFGKMEKIIAIWLAFLVMALWIGVGVFCWFLH